MAGAAALCGGMVFSNESVFAHSGEIHVASAYQSTATEFGEYDPEFEPDRRIEVRMDDSMRFQPERIEVEAEEVIQFDVINEGRLMHEFVLGTSDSLTRHAEMMKKFPNMEHDEPYMAHVPSGESRTIVWRFVDAGTVSFACLLPGHFDAGMKGVVEVK